MFAKILDIKFNDHGTKAAGQLRWERVSFLSSGFADSRPNTLRMQMMRTMWCLKAQSSVTISSDPSDNPKVSVLIPALQKEETNKAPRL